MSKFSEDAKARRAQQAGVEPGPHGPVSERFMRHYYGPSMGAQQVDAEEMLEAAYWEFDARRKGHGRWSGMPQAERDAFKTVARGLMRRGQ